MTGKSTIAASLGVLFALPCGVRAQDVSNWQLGVGPFFPVEVSESRGVNVGGTISLQRPIKTTGMKGLVAALDVAFYSADNDQTIFLALPSIGYQYDFQGGVFALKAGVGPLFSSNSKGSDSTNLGFVLSLRAGDERRQHFEFRRIFGPKEGQDGYSVQVVFPVRF